ncbi:hypothetical protein DL770_002041 [Monosporascus sp. CRB-9-2]|nr:hypothetical protein DL770_002041 [Monosporascus sp. CRB-9-2]
MSLPFGSSITASKEVAKAAPDRVRGRTFLITGSQRPWRWRGRGSRAADAHGPEQGRVEPVMAEITSVSPMIIETTFVEADLSDLASRSEGPGRRESFVLCDEGDDDAPKTTSQGAASLLAATLDPARLDSNHPGGGAFTQNCRVAETAVGYAAMPGNAARLWAPSGRLVGQGFDLWRKLMVWIAYRGRVSVG